MIFCSPRTVCRTQSNPTKILFLCSQNRLRSPTAERIFSGRPELEVRSAGIDRGATVPLTPTLLEWADLVFVMESRQRNVLRRKFRDLCRQKRIICLNIPDEYDYMDAGLVRLLTERVTPHLTRPDAPQESGR